MDNLTHSLIGAALGQAGLKRKTGLAMPALIIGANLPDVDAGCVVYGIESLAMRRGITHGPIAMLVLPLALAGGLWWFDKWQERRGKRPVGRAPVHFGWLFALSLIACLSHPLFDWFNNYGVRLLEPFSHQWFYGDTLFIIDPWIIAMLGAGVWFSLRRERAGIAGWTVPAQIGLVGVASFALLNLGISRQQQSEFGSQLVNGGMLITSPVPFAFWQRQHILGMPKGPWYVATASLDGTYTSDLSPLTKFPCAWPDTATIAKLRPDLRAFLFWSRAPYAERADDGDYVVIRDARFAGFGTRDRFQVSLRDTRCVRPPSRMMQ